jgi:putative FmdB family regulatory protein
MGSFYLTVKMGEYMPFYDYSCQFCSAKFEIRHGMNEKPKVVCPKCGSKDTSKEISLCGIIVRKTTAINLVKDHLRKEHEQRTDLRENYGVEKINPLRGASFGNVYGEIKKQGNLVRDQMQAQHEIDTVKNKAKRREWLVKANKRLPERTRIMKEKKAQEAAEKRKIII